MIRNIQKSLSELSRHGQLLLFLAVKDILIRYRYAYLGVLWSIIRPSLMVIIFVVVFDNIAGLSKYSNENTPYYLIVLSAVAPWQFFSSAMQDISGSIIGNSQIITKVYFPRVILPLAAVAVNLIDYLIMVFLCFLAALYEDSNSVMWVRLSLIPVIAMWTAATSLSIGLIFAGLNVKYRDFRYIIPFILQIGAYATPIGYESSMIPAEYKVFFFLNPLAGIIDVHRWIFCGTTFSQPLWYYALGPLFAGVFLVLGAKVFRTMEKNFSDII